MRLPLGKYSFYAFANLQSLEDGTSLYQKITGAHSLAELSEVKILDSGTSIDTRNEEKKGKFGGEEASRKRIPMSSYAQEYTLKPGPGREQIRVPLIRMIGKVQVKITNNLDKSITVKQLDIMNLRKGSLPIWLLPWGNNKYLENCRRRWCGATGPESSDWRDGKGNRIYLTRRSSLPKRIKRYLRRSRTVRKATT